MGRGIDPQGHPADDDHTGDRQAARLAGTGVLTNAEMTPRLVRDAVRADAAAREALRGAYRMGALSARGHERILRVARTVADLDGSDRVRVNHVTAALGLRQDDVLEAEAAA
jgi:magnesium chelatase family protein